MNDEDQKKPASRENEPEVEGKKKKAMRGHQRNLKGRVLLDRETFGCMSGATKDNV